MNSNWTWLQNFIETNHQQVWDSNTFIAPSHELIDYTLCKIIFDKIKCIEDGQLSE